MTVHRKSATTIAVDRMSIAGVVRSILKKHPYRNTTESRANSLFTTNVKPNWWLLGTKMLITLEDSDGSTLVTVETESQRIIQGDVFDYYNRYINDFLRNLSAGLESSRRD